ncbi:MAG TPA: hypothetical protein PK198_18135 [Saprospiraceae bacterium]|nr:hypothetical protein [Saprospiraceae bacterium]HRK80838.1 hypothetical protein [Saprospiraceae bacterium]
MLHHWIRPVGQKSILGDIGEGAPVMGRTVSFYDEDTADLNGVHVALVGIGDEEADAVRRSLYRMSCPFEGLKITDMGNLRKPDAEFAVAPIRELIDSKIFPVLIGRDVSAMTAQYKAFLSLQQWINLVLADEKLKSEEPYLRDVLHRKEAKLFHFGLLGCQAHFMLPGDWMLLEERHYDVVRLGAARANPEAMEPVVRDADLMAFHVNALRHSDAPGQEEPSPGGFTMEEACQISRYAGMSDKLKSFGIFGYHQEWDVRGQTAQVIAQMIWYCLEGFYQRKGDFPASTSGLTEYVVDMKDFDGPLVFWKSEKSGRWWFQLAVKAGRKPQRHRLIPCSYEDYRMACRNELPDRLIYALRRFG